MNTINETGRLEIIRFIEENHTKPLNALHCLSEWIADAQRDLDNGETPIVEIRYHNSVSGHTVAHVLSPDCWDNDAEPEEMDADSLSGFFGYAVEESGDVTADMSDEDITALIETYAQEALDTDPPATFDHADMRAWIERQRDYLREAAE